ncbi:hypothetical protein J3R30DRAFT_3288116 [Lentinula aciculospora]|uniref:RING-type domain-containing protein n=1 Tax=Lentinula aciculospora TaxID=153920 RepID=A0A9W9AG13_9AGAR|nr:hypothetical protein J3R30DRAFT_3288116 [Lentinula aciculospora]
MRRVEENLELIRQDDQDLDSASQSKSRSRSQPHQLSHLLNDEYPVVSQAQSTKGKGKAKALDVPEDEEVKDEVEVESFESVGVYSARQKGKSSKAKGKQKASVAANLSSNIPTTSTSTTSNTSSSSIPSDILAQLSLSSYTCPICFCAPTNATVTPCGHIACGSCLFTAVKTALRRETMMGTKDDGGPRCPVCRATIPGWDGKGGGVIGLVMQTITVA